MENIENTNTQDAEQEEAPDALSTLKARADLMGISYHPSIGVEKLREKIAAKLDGKQEPEEAPAAKKEKKAAAVQEEETEGQRQSRLKKEANELIRVRIQCMNPAKSEWEGEIFSIGNSLVGTIKKYIPFNADEGWHVPRMLLDMIKERQCQVFVTTTDSRGNKVRKGKLIKEFNIEYLDPLTPAELQELARRQAMARSVD